MPVTLSTRDPGFEAGFRQLLAAKRESAADVDAAVAEIIENVAARGDAALIDYTRRFDGMDLAADSLRLTAREIADCAAAAHPETIAALAYGTATIAPVDKIVGPGNAYVAAAKRRVFGKVGIDMIAGPSEILVVADRHNDPEWIAADLLSQAEHDGAAQAILITNDTGFAAEGEAAVERHLAQLPRTQIARAS